jgi:hypothetical protein
MSAKKKVPAKPKTYKGKSTKPGGGGAFAMMVDALTKKGMSKDRASAIAAAQGRKKYGAKKFTRMGVAGRKRAAKKK